MARFLCFTLTTKLALQYWEAVHFQSGNRKTRGKKWRQSLHVAKLCVSGGKLVASRLLFTAPCHRPRSPLGKTGKPSSGRGGGPICGNKGTPSPSSLRSYFAVTVRVSVALSGGASRANPSTRCIPKPGKFLSTGKQLPRPKPFFHCSYIFTYFASFWFGLHGLQ